MGRALVTAAPLPPSPPRNHTTHTHRPPHPRPMAARPPAALCAALVLSAVWLASATTEEPPSPNGDAPPTILEQVGRPAAPPVLLRRLSPPLVARVQLPLLAVLATYFTFKFHVQIC